jgi:hypothetical protein
MGMMTAASTDDESYALFFGKAEELWRNRHSRTAA